LVLNSHSGWFVIGEAFSLLVKPPCFYLDSVERLWGSWNRKDLGDSVAEMRFGCVCRVESSNFKKILVSSKGNRTC